jgi:hypothetical protein
MHWGRALVVALLLLSGACAQTFDAATLGVPVTMANAAGDAPEGERFSVNSSSVFAMWGLLKISSPSLQKALAQQLVGGKGVTNLKIRVRSRWSDLLITGLTLGLVVPRTVTFEGVVTTGEVGPSATKP